MEIYLALFFLQKSKKSILIFSFPLRVIEDSSENDQVNFTTVYQSSKELKE